MIPLMLRSPAVLFADKSEWLRGFMGHGLHALNPMDLTPYLLFSIVDAS
jgi:hypothetical protein